MTAILSRIAASERELRRARDRAPDAVGRRRAAILLAYLVLRSQRGVATVLGHARSTVQDALGEFLVRGFDSLRDRRRGPPKVFDRERIFELLRELASTSPREHGWPRSTWTSELFVLEVERRLKVAVSRSHMSHLLREAGCRRRKPALTIARAPANRGERMVEIAQKLMELPDDAVILCADEVDIHLNPKIGPDWCPPGVRKEAVTPGQNAKAYIAGAFDPISKELTYVSGPKKASALFIRLVQALAERHAEAGPVHLLVDNYIIHRSKITQKALADLEGKVVLHFLPPYSPEYNPIERVWWDLHAAVTRNHRCANLGELMEQVEAHLKAYDGNGQAAVTLPRAA